MLQKNKNNTNQLLIPQVEHMLDLMKEEIAEEFGITLGADTTARENGAVGGEMTKRLVQMAQEQIMSTNQNNIH